MNQSQTKKKISHENNKTQKNRSISGKILRKNNRGWLILEIRGNPFERGYAHGNLLITELKHIKKILPFLVKTQLKIKYEKYLKDCKRIITPILKSKYSEFYEEMCGISDGCNQILNIDEIIAWNSFLSMYSYYTDNNPYKCSAFIATGNATSDGKIVMAHNTHCNFIEGQTQNIILYVYPDKGNSFVMQTAPGYIASGTDWFICSTGIMGCETTISQTNYNLQFGTPYFCRIRHAMQYATNLDSYIEIMLKENAGDYACSWMFGDIKTNEIVLFELGLKEKAIQRTSNGAYYGMNSAIDNDLRLKETDDVTLYDLEKSSGSRNFRLNYLLNDKYYGKINKSTAKLIISDHYDSFLNKEELNLRSICKHSENQNSAPETKIEPSLFGSTDAKIVTSSMAKNMEFYGRFGSGCGRTFNISEFIKKHPKYKKWSPYVKNIPRYDWTTITGTRK